MSSGRQVQYLRRRPMHCQVAPEQVGRRLALAFTVLDQLRIEREEFLGAADAAQREAADGNEPGPFAC